MRGRHSAIAGRLLLRLPAAAVGAALRTGADGGSAAHPSHTGLTLRGRISKLLAVAAQGRGRWQRNFQAAQSRQYDAWTDDRQQPLAAFFAGVFTRLAECRTPGLPHLEVEASESFYPTRRRKSRPAGLQPGRSQQQLGREQRADGLHSVASAVSHSDSR